MRWRSCWSFRSTTAAAPQETFATPEAAVDALIAALKADSDSAMVAIFGEEHKDLVVTSDRAATSATRAKILAAMQTLRVLQEPKPDRRVLLIGDLAWPVPIPIVRAGERWRFATEEGEDEIANRRIGGNERNAIYVLHAYLDAQRAFAARDRDGDGVLQYAQKVASTPGKRDGLYWPADAAKDEEASPFGPLIAEGAAYLKGHVAGDPYRGYYFRILTRQGKSAPGGAYSYVINGRMIAGFAMVAYPRRIRQERRDDVHRQPQRQGLRKGPRQEFCPDRREDDDVRSGGGLETDSTLIVRVVSSEGDRSCSWNLHKPRRHGATFRVPSGSARSTSVISSSPT